MDDIFLKLVHLSISASWMAVVVIMLRLLLKKAPKWVFVVMWGLVAFRLICPFEIESRYSKMPEQISSGQIIYEWTDEYVGTYEIIHEYQSEFDDAVAQGREPIDSGNGEHYVVTAPDKRSEPATVGNTIVPILSCIWIVGMSCMFLYAAASYVKVFRSLERSVRCSENVYQGDYVVSPFVIGIMKPRIYLPFRMSEEDMSHVIAHEQAHIYRKDHWWKPLGFLLLSVYWFNPVMWLSYILLCRDIEQACDQRVIKEMDLTQRANYSQALLNCCIHHKMILACPLAFGEVGVKERVNNILRYQKPRLWITILAVAAMIVSSVFFLTVAAEEESIQVEDNDHLSETEDFPSENVAEENNSQVENDLPLADRPAFAWNLAEAENIPYENVVLTADQVTPSGLRLHCKIEDFDETWTGIYMITGAPYRIEKLTDHGWELLAMKMLNIEWRAERIWTKGTNDWWIDWTSVYGILDEGTYRITTDVLEDMDPVTAEFHVKDSGNQTEDNALARCHAALQELLDRDSYHILSSYEPTSGQNSAQYIEWWKSGDDFLELTSRTMGEICEGKMKRNGTKYRLDHEVEWDGTTPVAGWSVWPDLADDRAAEWASAYIFGADQAEFPDDVAVISENQITFVVNDADVNYEETKIVTYYFDEHGKLESILVEADLRRTNGEYAEKSLSRLEIYDTDAAIISGKIAELDVNFYRSFSWDEDRKNRKALEVGFRNTTEQPITSAPEAIARAEEECSVDYTKIVVYRDEAAGMWKVEYQIMYGRRGYQYIYMNDDGITQMISAAGSNVEEWERY